VWRRFIITCRQENVLIVIGADFCCQAGSSLGETVFLVVGSLCVCNFNSIRGDIGAVIHIRGRRVLLSNLEASDSCSALPGRGKCVFNRGIYLHVARVMSTSKEYP